eukprot:7480968-Alexandrium_andersonii.AAC.1
MASDLERGPGSQQWGELGARLSAAEELGCLSRKQRRKLQVYRTRWTLEAMGAFRDQGDAAARGLVQQLRG